MKPAIARDVEHVEMIVAVSILAGHVECDSIIGSARQLLMHWKNELDESGLLDEYDDDLSASELVAHHHRGNAQDFGESCGGHLALKRAKDNAECVIMCGRS